jgi:NhaP-type Na+/H+ or K+/H+ antiporter
LSIPWPLVLALVLPPLLWQVALRLATAHSEFTWKAWLAWLLTTLLIGLAVMVGASVSPTGALLLGILAASLVWQVRKRATGSTELGAFGQLALAFLLVEVDVVLHPMDLFMGSLFVGAGLGLILGYIGVRVAFSLPAGDARNYFCLGLAYLAYLAGVLIGGSGVVTAAITGLMVAVYGYNVSLWSSTELLPAPLNRLGVFLLMAGVFLLLGWQIHPPLIETHVAGIVLGLLAAAIGILIGRWLAPLPEEATQSVAQTFLRKERKVFLLLLATLLLWPGEAVLEPWPLAVALLAALVTVLILIFALDPVFNLFGVEWRASDLPGSKNQEVPNE